MVTDGCTTITWNCQSSPVKNKHRLHQRKRQSDNALCTNDLDIAAWFAPLFNSSVPFFSVTSCFSNALRRIKNQADCHPVNQWDDIFTAGQLQKAVLYDKNIAKMATKLFYRWCWNTTRDIHCFRFTVVMEDNYLAGLFVLSFENSIHEKSKETLR